MPNKYEKVADDLRQKIQNGQFQPGDQLPVEQALRALYGFSLPVVRQALDVLSAEGLVDRVHGKGTFVRPPRQRVRRTPERYQWEKDRVHLTETQRRRTGATERDTGLTVDDLDFSAAYNTVPATPDLASAFGVPIGAKLLQRIYRTRMRREQSPLNVVYSYLVYDVAAENPELLRAENEPWPGGTQHQLSTIGIEIDRITDEIQARPPTPEEVNELVLPAGVPVFLVRKISVDVGGSVVEISDIVCPADRTEFSYTTSLKRWKK